MEGFEALEDRITSMELKVFGKRNPHNFDFNTSIPVTLGLVDVNVLISSALSGRETIISTLTRLPELNECLDPNYEENLMSSDSKMEYVLAMEPEIKSIAEQLKNISNSLPVLDSEPIKNVPNNCDKLNKVAYSYLEIKQEHDSVSNNIIEAIQKYNDIMHSITKNLSQLESTITELEIAKQPKVVIE
ncbi:dynactin subunit 3-like [Chrysoperla carnea]|uniref:dynactin subunit 3-like n=1 Tax=Chrysoperla carnea TaxID=189513 RepID=UPI001D0717E2|nr:dynactin subunit 3-like [Chrysoperla carnea]